MIKTKSMHIRLEYEEALDGKKQILSFEANILQLLKKLQNYKIIRKRELILKERLRQNLRALGAEINTIQEIFPRERAMPSEAITKENMLEKQQQISEKREIESQLRDIREKLARLDQ